MYAHRYHSSWLSISRNGTDVITVLISISIPFLLCFYHTAVACLLHLGLTSIAFLLHIFQVNIKVTFC